MKKLVVVLGAGVLVAGIVAGGLWQNLRAQRAHNRELAAEAARVEPAPAVQVAQPLPEAPEVPEAPAPAAAPVVAKAEPAAPPAAPPAKAEPAANANPLAAMFDNPQGQEMVRTMMRTVMARMYPDLAEAMDFTPEEASRFLDLLAEQQGSLGTESIAMLGGGMGDPAAMQETQRKLLAQQEANEAKLAAMLGSKYPRWEEYQSTAAARQQVNQISASLNAAGHPLSEAQSKALVAALATETAQAQRDEREWSRTGALQSKNMVAESVQRAGEAQMRMVDAAAPHLNAEQLALYRREVEQQVKMLGAVMGLLGGQGQGSATAPAGR